MRLLSFALLSMLLCFGCTKTERVYVPDNEAPPDRSVSTLKVETYVNKCYIGLLGRKPTTAELTQGVQTLRDSSLSAGGRLLMLSGILDKEEFLVKTYLNDGALLLNTWDSSLYAFYLDQYLTVRQDTAIYNQYSAIVDTTIVGLVKLLAIPQYLKDGTIDVRTMHSWMVNNYVYEDINMGGENFVKATFDHFLMRNPTTAELAEGIKMFDGFEAVVFTKTGDSRYDFVEIFFGSNAYYEGQVRWAFQRFLYRDAETEELAYFTNIYRQTGSQQILFSQLLSLNEYASF